MTMLFACSESESGTLPSFPHNQARISAVYCPQCARFPNQWCRDDVSEECVCAEEATAVNMNDSQLWCIREGRE